MTGSDDLAAEFDRHRARLRDVARRLLGSTHDADDAVQETWLRFERTDRASIDNVAGWLTTVVSRIALNMVRNERRRVVRDIPDPSIELLAVASPEDASVVAESVSGALLVVLDALPPATRLAFVLHDLFGLPFDEIAPITGTTPGAARQLASRARRRVRGARPEVPPSRTTHRRIVEAFFTAARSGDLDGLIQLLAPGVVLRADSGETVIVRGSSAVAQRARLFASPERTVRFARVNSRAGATIDIGGVVVSVMEFLVVDDRIAAIYALTDHARLARLGLDGSARPTEPSGAAAEATTDPQ